MSASRSSRHSVRVTPSAGVLFKCLGILSKLQVTTAKVVELLEHYTEISAPTLRVGLAVLSARSETLSCLELPAKRSRDTVAAHRMREVLDAVL